MPPWEELMHHTRQRTEAENTLIMAIAALSVCPGYSHMTPDQVYNHVVAISESVKGDVIRL